MPCHVQVIRRTHTCCAMPCIMQIMPCIMQIMPCIMQIMPCHALCRSCHAMQSAGSVTPGSLVRSPLTSPLPKTAPAWPQDGFKMAPRSPQDGQGQGPMEPARPLPKMDKTITHYPRWTRPQDGFKMAPRWPQDGQERYTYMYACPSAPMRLHDAFMARLHGVIYRQTIQHATGPNLTTSPYQFVSIRLDM